MKRLFWVLVFVALARCPLQATPDNVPGGEAPGYDFDETIRLTMEQFGLCGRVREEQDRVVVYFTLAFMNLRTTGMKLQLEQRGGRLAVLLCDQSSKAILSCPIPDLPCPVVAGEVESEITSTTNFEIIFRKAQPTVTVTEVPEGLLTEID